MSYWQDRMDRLDNTLERREKSMQKRVERFYERELKRLEKDIAAFYQQYGADGVLEYRQMLQDLLQADFDLLMKDCEAFAKKYPEHADMVAIRKGIWKLARMEGLQLYAKLHLAQAMGESMEGMEEHFTEVAKDSAQSIADTAGESFHIYDDAAVRQFVGVEWSDGEGYSGKLWKDASKVASYVQQDLVDGIVRGASYRELCEQMRRRFGQSEYNTMRVVRTEGTYVSRQAQVATMEQVGIETYRIATEKDNRTCGRCHRVEDAGEIPLSKRVVGENFPPLHPNCRCQINVGPDVDEWLRRRRIQRRKEAGLL